MVTKKVWLFWNNITTHWDKLTLDWDKLFLLIEIAGGGGSGGLLVNADEVWKSVDRDLKKKGFDEEKREKFFKLIVEVNGLKSDTSRKLDTIKKRITVDHIKNTIAKVAPDVRIQAVQVRKK